MMQQPGALLHSSAPCFSSCVSPCLIRCSNISSSPGCILRNPQRQQDSRFEVCRKIRLSRSFVAAAAVADAAGSPDTRGGSKWLLEPIGDGDCSHLEVSCPLPSAFEVSSDSCTVGRVEGKADIVIPVQTVSGLHARLEKKDKVLLVTDLDSTNGTYVDNQQIRPGAVTPVPPGSSITFGDEHLAQFKFSLVDEDEPKESE